MSTKFQLLFFLNALVAIQAYNYRFVVEDGVKDCPGRPASESYKKYFDLSQFSLTRVDDNTCEINGKIISLADFKGIWAMVTTTDHQENGVWTPGILTVSVPNVCNELNLKSRPWYEMYASFNRKECPPRIGTESVFVEQLVDLTVNDTDIKIPIGNWRAMNSFTLLPMGSHKFCMSAEFEVFLA